MIEISRLYNGLEVPASDAVRYRRTDSPMGPVVVWNATARCNLTCRHCYASSSPAAAEPELNTAQATAMIDDLARMNVPVLLLSGGEPLCRGDLFELIGHARSAGLRVVLSTNATLIDESVATKLAEAEVGYVGISLDGPEPLHNALRGQPTAYAHALRGLRHCRYAGLRVGLRMTLHAANADTLDETFALIRRERIPRVCFYHFVPAGRGGKSAELILPPQRTRRLVMDICRHSAELHRDGLDVQVMTVDNHADGPFVQMMLAREHPERAAASLRLLQQSRGNRSGERIACVGWQGHVMPDQFWRSRVVGHVQDRPFSEIWTDPHQPLLAALRNRAAHLTGRCTRCRWMDVCNGNLRARADAAGDAWGDDPGCYLTDEEIAPDHG